MILSYSPVVRWAIHLSLLAVMGWALTGCAEMTSNPKPARLEGNRLYNTGNYADAAGAYRNAIQEDPRDYQSHYGLAVSYEAMGSYQQAISQYKTTLDVMTRTLAGREDIDFRAQVIDALAACVARSDSRDIETTALAQQASSTQKAEDWFILAKVYAHSGDADSALDAYYRASMLDKSNFHLNKAYGLYLLQLGQHRQAIEPLQRAYAINSEDEEVNQALRQAGVVPGLHLKDQRDLARPPLPKGPIAAPRWMQTAPPSDAPADTGSGSSAQAPRD